MRDNKRYVIIGLIGLIFLSIIIYALKDDFVVIINNGYNQEIDNDYRLFSDTYLRLKGLLGLVFTIYTIFIGIVIFVENKDPAKTISWLLILFIFPVLGFVIYLFLGQNIRKKNIFKKKENITFKNLEDIAELQLKAVREDEIFVEEKDFLKRKLISLILNNSKSPVTINNRSKVLTNGKDKFRELKKDLRNATEHIHLEYFIIKNDNIGKEIKDILIQKSKEGVEVRLIYDSVGSWKLGRKYINELKTSGVVVVSFLPVFLPGLSREINYRNHRKIVVIDGCLGYLGGINIGDEYLGKDKKLGFWRDTHIKIEGEAVYQLQNVFINDWYFCKNKKLTGKKYFPKLKHYGEELIQISSSGPDTCWDSIMQSYFSLITYASERVWITTPYLIPDESVKKALIIAALSGIDVRIIIPDIADHITAFWGSRANVEELLKSGVRIYKYQRGFIHSKVLIVDEIATSVGTANLDYRSFLINFEINAFIYDSNAVKRLEIDYYNDIKNSEEICLEEWLSRPFSEKFKESIGRLLSPLL